MITINGGVYVVPEQTSCFCQFYVQFEIEKHRSEKVNNDNPVKFIIIPFNFKMLETVCVCVCVCVCLCSLRRSFFRVVVVFHICFIV